MSTSLPSRVVYVVDVPEVKTFSATFNYDFFTTDESTTENSAIPDYILKVPATDIDATYAQQVKLKVPRYVLLQWTNQPHVVDRVGDITNTSTDSNDLGLITPNINKVMTETQFASYNFTSVLFNDMSIDQNARVLISSSIDLLTIDQQIDSDASGQKLAMKLNTLLDGQITNEDLVFATMTDLAPNGSTFFIGSTLIEDGYLQALKSVETHVQVNSRLLEDMVEQGISDPYNQHNSTLEAIKSAAKQLSKQLIDVSVLPTDDEFKTVLPPIDVTATDTTNNSIDDDAVVVGFIIDKYSIDNNGNVKQHAPIIIESSKVTTTYDFSVQYGVTYVYDVRTVALYKIPVIDKNTYKKAIARALVSSKPSNKLSVTCVEIIPPPPPADIDFIWNYEINKLYVTWSFPTNSQRDIKKFQVFRRKNTDNPFELIKMYDFDDSDIKVQTESEPTRLTEFVISPPRFYIDDDFTTQSKYIYTLCCIDAHGMTSNYGAQFLVSFDVFKNKLKRSLVSHSGAPKPYPNMFLEADAFVDTFSVSGENAKNMKVYFDPQFYTVTNGAKASVDVISTKQKGGSYQINLINTDNQTLQTVSIMLDDKTSALPTK